MSLASQGQTFQARVIQILETRQLTTDQGQVVSQQNLKLKGLSGDYQGQEFNYLGIDDYQLVDSQVYQIGDKVWVSAESDVDNQVVFYVLDHVRTNSLYLLILVFCLAVILIGGWQGMRSLLSLLVSLVIICGLIIPAILSNYPVLPVGIGGAMLILICIIYLTEGINLKSHLAIFSILICLVITSALAVVFTNLTQLNGLAQDEVAYLITIPGLNLNFQGLLLVGIILGTLGVLDDVVIGQIEAVKQLKIANQQLSRIKVFSLGMQVGKAHLGAIINTLFLAYAGAALPLLLLINLNPTGVSLEQILSNPVMMTEIVRTIVGSLGLVLAVPIATFLASQFLKPGQLQ